MLPARALPADGLQEQRSLGRIGDGAAVDGLGDLGSFPLDLAKGAGGQQPAFDGVPERVGEHGPLAAGGGRGGGLAVQPPGAGVQDAADGVRFVQRGHGQGRFRDPGQRAGCRGDGPAGGGGVNAWLSRGLAQDRRVGDARRGGVRARVTVVRPSAAERRESAARSGHFIWL